MLKEGRMTPGQFLDRILHITNHTTEYDRIEDDKEIDDSDKVNEPRKGVCISCREKICDIILLPCFDIVICSSCWLEKQEKHISNCEAIYKDNKRKLAIEKKKILCPCCGQLVSKWNPFQMATM